MAVWDDVITERDKLVYKASGYGEGQIGFGQKPALVIIDVTYNFVGDKPEPILESIKRFPYSCGEEGWAAVYQIASLLRLVREKGVPVVYTASSAHVGVKPEGWVDLKCPRIIEVARMTEANDIVKDIAPEEKDVVVYKPRASMFYGTPMLSILNALQVDTLLVCGTTTSGCVRASVVEAMANNYRVAVIEECTFDRGQVSHKVNLFDMNAKYADVVSVAEVRDYLNKRQVLDTAAKN